MRRLFKGVVIVALVVPVAALAAIANSKHDLSVNSTNGGIKAAAGGPDQICIFCHTPHGARAQLLLWNQAPSTNATSGWTAPNNVTTATTTLAADLSAVSKRCLNCHDGSVAIGDLANAGGGVAGQITLTDPRIPSHITANALDADAGANRVGVGGDMTGNHPVSVSYPGQTGSGYTALPATYNATTAAGCTGGAVNCVSGSAAGLAMKLFGAVGTLQVECATCHDVHNDAGQTFLLKVANTNSALCLGCHVK
jgi:predicted CXXCH cytochrome family protein